MKKIEIQNLLLKHDEEITQIKISTGHMLFLWKAFGATSLLMLGAAITALFAWIAR